MYSEKLHSQNLSCHGQVSKISSGIIQASVAGTFGVDRARVGFIFCILNIYFSDQSEIDECLSSGGELIQRSDDNIESITNRINVYREQTEPLLEYYKSIGLLIIADGNGEIDEVYKRVLKLTNMMD